MSATGFPWGVIATYPLDSSLAQPLHAGPTSVTDKVDAPIMSTSSYCTTISAAEGKENASPNRVSKRLPEATSMRKMLKRCRGTNSIHSTSNLSIVAEMHQNFLR